MTLDPGHLRYERKFVVRHLPVSEVLVAVRRHPALFREVYPPRFVNNVYLDTPGLGDYFDHINGVARRVKTRVRWYGPLEGRIEQPRLERKLKRGLVSGKVSQPLASWQLNGARNGHGIQALLTTSALPETWQACLRHLEPSLVNRYHRHYFLSADGACRLTVDSGLGFLPWGVGVEDHVHSIRPLPEVVLELKFAPEHGLKTEALTNALPFRLARCSKYVLGIEAIGRG